MNCSTWNYISHQFSTRQKIYWANQKEQQKNIPVSPIVDFRNMVWESKQRKNCRIEPHGRKIFFPRRIFSSCIQTKRCLGRWHECTLRCYLQGVGIYNVVANQSYSLSDQHNYEATERRERRILTTNHLVLFQEPYRNKSAITAADLLRSTTVPTEENRRSNYWSRKSLRTPTATQLHFKISP